MDGDVPVDQLLECGERVDLAIGSVAQAAHFFLQLDAAENGDGVLGVGVWIASHLLPIREAAQDAEDHVVREAGVLAPFLNQIERREEASQGNAFAALEFRR